VSQKQYLHILIVFGQSVICRWGFLDISTCTTHLWCDMSTNQNKFFFFRACYYSSREWKVNCNYFVSKSMLKIQRSNGKTVRYLDKKKSLGHSNIDAYYMEISCGHDSYLWCLGNWILICTLYSCMRWWSHLDVLYLFLNTGIHLFNGKLLHNQILKTVRCKLCLSGFFKTWSVVSSVSDPDEGVCADPVNGGAILGRGEPESQGGNKERQLRPDEGREKTW
jgi:hypothetical protein